MRSVKAGTVDPIPLYYRGEKDATQVVFPLADFIRTFGEGEAQLVVRRAGDPKEYAAPVERVGDTAVWTVGPEWVAVDGSGSCQLSWIGADFKAKGAVYKTRAYASMGESNETAPEPQTGYLAQVQEAGAQAAAAERNATQLAGAMNETARRFDAVAERTMKTMETAAEDAKSYAGHPPVIGENGNWMEWNGEAYMDTGKPSRGADGQSYELSEEDKDEIRNGLDTFRSDELGRLWAAVNALLSGTAADCPTLARKRNVWYMGTRNKGAMQAEETDLGVDPLPGITELHFVGSYTKTGDEDEVWTVPTTGVGTVRGYRTGSVVTVCVTGAEKIKLPANSQALFRNVTDLKKITGLERLDASAVTTFNAAFNGCAALEEIDMGAWYTPELSNIAGMFHGDSSLKIVRFPRYGMPKVTSATGVNLIFWGCEELREVDFGGGLTIIPAQTFYKKLELEKVVGLSSVATVGEQAFTYTPKLTDADLIAANLQSIGAEACRLTGLEDSVDLSAVPVDAVGDRATRRRRWTAEEQEAIVSVVIPEYVYLEVPNMDSQSNYTFTYGTLDGVSLNVANGGCSALSTYHEWQAIHHRYGGTVYPDFKAWWDDVFGEGNTIGDIANATLTLRSKLGWTSANKQYVASSIQKQAIIDSLKAGRPMFASMYTSNALNGQHAILIIGMDDKTQKFAILDPNVIINDAPDNTRKAPGVVSWLAFEDIFVNGPREDGGPDNIHPVASYDVQTH